MIRRPPRSTQGVSSAASDVYKRQTQSTWDTKGIPVIPDFLLNGGGVTVSYFEWLKGLQHSKLGRLTKGWEKKSRKDLLKLLGKESTSLERGAEEKDIVYTALEEIMAYSVREVFDLSEKMKVSMRVAGYVIAITKIANCYEETGFDVQPSVLLSLIHISEPTRPLYISYAVFCLKKKKKKQNTTHSESLLYTNTLITGTESQRNRKTNVETITP
eukprot:TRINITY_DN23595_c0_g1_i1.p2 TRINITY_DN23595_c0_g1~~TRINITY_DN23595_c0_g1_i1.p2  ORF type:complete len:215 (-),score=51.70 TRINITY_DN23595_c0_g1_i1:9-653(-)